MTTTILARPTRVCEKETLERRLACLADAGPQAVEERLQDLDGEWTAGRIATATLGTVSLIGLGLGLLHSPVWFALPAIGGVLMLQYLAMRTSWVGEAYRAAGFRTHSEIDKERMALKVLRGDFRHIPTIHDVENREDISRLEGEGGIVIEPEEAKVDAKQAAEAVTASVA
jgi:hypothetical protein